MDLEKVRKIIEREAPQYEIVDTGAAESESDAATDDPADVDANSAPLSSWDKFQTPTPDEADAKPDPELEAMRARFRRRAVKGGAPDRPAVGDMKSGKTGLVRVRPRGAADDAGDGESKDLIVDEDEGIIGAQG